MSKAFLVGGILTISACTLQASERLTGQTDEVHGLYQDISKELMSMRKENPTLKDPVFKMLDGVGKLYRHANTALQERVRGEQVGKEDREATMLLRSENQKLKGDLAQLSSTVEAKSIEVSKAQ